MRALVTGTQMKQIDSITIQEIGIPSLVLMERAAMAVVDEVRKQAGREDRIWCACGCGNNGADGVAAGRMLHLAGYSVTILLVGDPMRGSREFQQQVSIAERLGLYPVHYQDFFQDILQNNQKETTKKQCDILIDAIFGVGLSRPVEGEYRELIELLTAARPKLTVAVDIPSGISSDSGQILGAALQADITVTFGWEKLGTVLFPGREYAGKVVTADIGFPQEAFRIAEERWQEEDSQAISAFTFEKEEIGKKRPSRPSYSNKGSFGKVLVVAGSRNMGGAAYLSGLAAYRTGAGLVRILTVEENREFLQMRLPEAVLETYEPLFFADDPGHYRKILERDCQWADVVVLGPGLGQETYAKNLTEMVLTMAHSPIIVDADGLNLIAVDSRLTRYFTENIILTPHLGEMARLIGKTVGEIQKDLIGTARTYAAHYGINCVLKDAATITALRDGRVFVNTSGCSAMAKAGSGDVLTGIIAGLIAQGMDEMEGTVLGVCLHGAAGERCREKKGEYALLASELADCAGEILGEDGLGEKGGR